MSTPTNRERALKQAWLDYSRLTQEAGRTYTLLPRDLEAFTTVVNSALDAVEQAASLNAAQNAWDEGVQQLLKTLDATEAGRINPCVNPYRNSGGVEASSEDTRKDQPNVSEPDLQAVTTPAAVSSERLLEFVERLAAPTKWADMSDADFEEQRDSYKSTGSVDDAEDIGGIGTARWIAWRARQVLAGLPDPVKSPTVQREELYADQLKNIEAVDKWFVQREEESPKRNPSVQQALDVLAWRPDGKYRLALGDTEAGLWDRNGTTRMLGLDIPELAPISEREKGYGIKSGSYYFATDPDKLNALIEELQK
jgi:hypothetical protein